MKDVEITGLQVDNANRVFVLRGFPNDPVAGLKLNGVDVRQARNLGIIENVSELQLHEVTVNGASLSADELLRV